MLVFPRFKSPQTYAPYKKHALTNWENMVLKTGFVFLLIEIAQLIEDFNHGQYTVWSVLWIAKVVNIGFYFSCTFGRWLLSKFVFKRHKRVFVDTSEIMILLTFILVTVYSPKIPTSPQDPNPLWTSQATLTGYLRVIGLCFSFYNWILPMLIIAANISYGAYNAEKLLPGYAGIYLPTYINVILCVGFFSFIIEKSRRDNFEAHLEANMKEKVWKEILNELPEGTLIMTEQKEVVYVNHSFYTILNMDIERGFDEISELKNIRDISLEGFSTNSSAFGSDHPINKFQELQDTIWNQWGTLVSYFNSPLPHEQYKIFKGQYQIDENKSKTFEIKFTIRNFGGRNVALFIFSDVSERLMVGYLKQNIEYKNKLLASVSHELRTPLNGNINFIQEVINDPTVPQRIKEARLIPAMRSAQYLLILINDILDFSQIQAQNIRLVPTVKNIAQTVKEAMQLVEIQAKKKGLYLNLEITDKNWPYELKTDHNRVLQIIANLLSNALKFTFSGGITVTLSPDKNQSVYIEVADTGIGIKEEDQSKLFKTFGKLDLGGKNYINSQGVGLGLVISNSLARMLGPKQEILNPQTMLLDDEEEEDFGIYFESEFGKGTKFWFRIVDQDDKQPYSHRMIPSEGSQINEIPEFVVTDSNAPLLEAPRTCNCSEFLIADDDAFNILTLETMLTNLGYRCDSVYNGQHALDQVIQRISTSCGENCQPYKMIFLDCNMPIMDGYDCAINLKKIFAENPEYECPIIACTAATNQTEKDRAFDSGMIDFVTKPINKTNIQKLINNYCIKSSSSSDSPII